MPEIPPGQPDPFTGKVPEPPKPVKDDVSGLPRLKKLYRAQAQAQATAQAEENAPRAVDGAGLVQVSARVGDNSEETVCYLNPDHIASIAPMAGKELEACIVTTADGATYKVHESTEAFSRRLAPPDLQPSGPTARLTEYHRSKAAAR